MNIHEYQAKELLAKFGVPVPAGHAAMSVDEAVAAAAKLPGPLYVVKAQIHAGGRGKGKFKELGPDAKGGVRLARIADEVRAAAADMLGNTLVTIQTGAAGQAGQPALRHRRRRHRQGILPRSAGRPEERPDRLRRLDRGRHEHRGGRARHAREDPHASTIDPATGFMPHHGRAVAHALGLERRSRQAGAEGRETALRRLRRHRRRADRDQPAGGDRRRRAARARRQGRLRFQCRVPPPRSRSAARRERGGSDGAGGERSTTSPTSSSTAISAAWSTAPASPWRRWTSSS